MRNTARPRILLVEDDAAVRRALQLLLTAEGYDVRSYGSGFGLERDPEALAAVCMIADLVIPRVNAIDLLANMRCAGWTGSAILITGYGTSEWARRAGECGYSCVLTKPIGETVLVNRVSYLLNEPGDRPDRPEKRGTDMIDIDFPGDNIALLTPEGALSAEDFAKVTEAINGYINETDAVPNIVIHARRMPHWDSIGALQDHLRFVRDHHKLVKKVAVVGDSLALQALPPIVDHFVAAKLRRFPEKRLAEAIAWATASDDHPGGFDPIEGLPTDVVAFRARGTITSQDYRDTLEPLVAEKLRDHDKLKCLFVLDEAFDTYSGEAAWDDARFGLQHFSDFSKIALVTDIGWIRQGTKLFAPFMRAQVQVFDVAELEDAKTWIRS